MSDPLLIKGILHIFSVIFKNRVIYLLDSTILSTCGTDDYGIEANSLCFGSCHPCICMCMYTVCVCVCVCACVCVYLFTPCLTVFSSGCAKIEEPVAFIFINV